MDSRENIFLDYDGVLLNSEELIVEYQRQSNLPWDVFFETLDWEALYNAATEINDALDLLLKLQKQQDNIYVLTKIHHLEEARVKIKLLRNRGILIPVFTVPPHIRKSDVVLPNLHSILIDDSQKNITDWEANGGKGILFDPNIEQESDKKVKSLKFLLNNGDVYGQDNQ